MILDPWPQANKNPYCTLISLKIIFCLISRIFDLTTYVVVELITIILDLKIICLSKFGIELLSFGDSPYFLCRFWNFFFCFLPHLISKRYIKEVDKILWWKNNKLHDFEWETWEAAGWRGKRPHIGLVNFIE